MTSAPPWVCPNCRTLTASAYCPACGERPAGPRDLTLGALGLEAFEAVSSVDGKLLRTMRTLILRPGALTAAYEAGARKPYIGPLGIFLAANALFFAVQSA